MQQPILFNTSIKDNIKFGVPDSSSSKIFQVAEAANTLSFIESNYEELSAEEQLDETRKQIRHFAVHRLQNPELVKISKLSDLEALEVVKLVLENSDDPFNAFLDDLGRSLGRFLAERPFTGEIHASVKKSLDVLRNLLKI